MFSKRIYWPHQFRGKYIEYSVENIQADIRGPCVRKLLTGLIMYIYPLKIKNIVLYCIVSWFDLFTAKGGHGHGQNCQISFCKMLKNKQYQVELLFSSFHLNGHTIGFHVDSKVGIQPFHMTSRLPYWCPKPILVSQS